MTARFARLSRRRAADRAARAVAGRDLRAARRAPGADRRARVADQPDRPGTDGAQRGRAHATRRARPGSTLRVFFARKANKALALVDEAKRLGLGVDVASERELSQVLDRGVDPADVIVTAAVKPEPLLELCVRSGATVAIDNFDELDLLLGGRDAGRRDDGGRAAPRAGSRALAGADPLRAAAARSCSPPRRGWPTAAMRSPACTSISTATTSPTASPRSARRVELIDRLRERGAAPKLHRHRWRHPDELPRLDGESGTTFWARIRSTLSTGTRSGPSIRTTSSRCAARGWQSCSPASARRSSSQRPRAALRAGTLAARRLRAHRRPGRCSSSAVATASADRARDEPHPGPLDLRRLPRRPAAASAGRRGERDAKSDRGLPGRRLLHRARTAHLARLAIPGRGRGGRPRRLPEHRRLSDAHPRERLAPDPTRAQPDRRRRRAAASTRSISHGRMAERRSRRQKTVSKSALMLTTVQSRSAASASAFSAPAS